VIAKVIIDEDHKFTEGQEWQIKELKDFIMNTEPLYLHLVSLCKQAVGKISKGKYDEAQHLGVIVDNLIQRAIEEYRPLDKTHSMKGKMVPELVRYKVALDVFNEEMDNLGYTRELRGGTSCP